MYKSATIEKITPALLKAQQQMGNATKDAKNPFYKSSYADLNSIREVALPVLNANGIVCLQPTVVVDGKNYVETTLLHESGEYIAAATEIKVTKQNDAQAEGSGISYARRYGLQSLLNIGAVDDDGESTVTRETKPATKTTTKETTAVKTETPKEATKEGTSTPKANGKAKATFKQEAKVTTTAEDNW